MTDLDSSSIMDVPIGVYIFIVALIMSICLPAFICCIHEECCKHDSEDRLLKNDPKNYGAVDDEEKDISPSGLGNR